MADAADIAGDTLEACSADAHRRQIGKSAPQVQPGYETFDGLHCVDEDCGIEIPAGRLALGRCRCIDCQERLDKVLH